MSLVKPFLDNSGTQDDGRSSRNHLELVLKHKIQVKHGKIKVLGGWGVGGMGEAAIFPDIASGAVFSMSIC